MNLDIMKLLNNSRFAIMALVAALIVSTVLLGITGLVSMLIMSVLFFLPIFLIINNLDLEADEKVFFSIFISLAMFSLVVWYINRVIYSLRISVIAAFFLLILIGLGFGFYNKKSGKPKHG